LANGIFNVVFQLYLVSLGFNSVAIGSIFMMNEIVRTLLTIPMGILADRYSRKKIALFGILPGSLFLIILISTKSLKVFRLAFLLLGLCNAAGVVWSPMFSSFFTREDMDRAFGLSGFLNIIGLSLGSLTGLVPPILVARYGFSLQSSYWTAMVLAAGFWAFSWTFSILSLRGVVEPKSQGGYKFNLKSKGVLARFCFLYLIGNLGGGVFFNLFPFYVNEKFGVESDGLGTLYFVSNFVQAGANIIAARISNKLGTLKTIVTTIGLCVPFYLMIPLVPSFTWLSVFYIIRLGIRSTANPLINSLFMKTLHEEEKSTANSILVTASSGIFTVTPWLGGQLMEQVSLDFPAYLGSGLYIIHSAAYYFLLRNVKEKTV
jgi:MFS family permease